jgi:hypothetical protein
VILLIGTRRVRIVDRHALDETDKDVVVGSHACRRGMLADVDYG